MRTSTFPCRLIVTAQLAYLAFTVSLPYLYAKSDELVALREFFDYLESIGPTLLVVLLAWPVLMFFVVSVLKIDLAVKVTFCGVSVVVAALNLYATAPVVE